MTNEQTNVEGGDEAEARTAVPPGVTLPSSIPLHGGVVVDESSTTETAVGEDWWEDGYAAAASWGVNGWLVTTSGAVCSR